MALPDRSDFMSPAAGAAWWIITVGNKRVACSGTGYDVATIAMDFVRQLQRRRTMRDWAGRAIPPLSGDVSFSSDLQRALFRIAADSAARGNAASRNIADQIRAEAEAGTFGYYSTLGAVGLVRYSGRWTSGTDVTRGNIDLPSNAQLPILNQTLTRSANPSNPVCNVIADSDPTPPSAQQTVAAVQATPQTPLAEPADKGPAGDKGVFGALEGYVENPAEGYWDSTGTYVPAASESIEITPMPGVVIPNAPTVPPPPSNITFISSGGPSSSGGVGTILVIAAVGLALFYALSQSESYSEQTTTVRRNPRRKKRASRQSRRR